MKWEIDNSHSVAEFSVKHMMISTVKGRFSNVSGVIELDETHPEKSRVEATIDAATINTGDQKRDAHLRSADFFDVEQYPTIEFKSTRVERRSQDEYRVTGNLTMHGVTREVTLEVEYSGQGKSPFGMTIAGYSARTSINRKDFGLNWNVALEAGGVLVSEKVNINLEVQAVLKAAVGAAA